MVKHTPHVGTHKILFVVTSCDRMGETDEPTGCHLEELATPYYILRDRGIAVDIASVDGGIVPVDPSSLKEALHDKIASVERFRHDTEAMARLESTLALHDLDENEYTAIYLPGGHGTMWDFPMNETLAGLLARAVENGKTVAAICHGPAAFVGVTLADGRPLIAGRRFTCFSNREERAVQKDHLMPFALQTRLESLGGHYDGAANFAENVVIDGALITGQNPASAERLGQELVRRLTTRRLPHVA